MRSETERPALRIERLEVTARMDDPERSLDYAKAEARAGDESWGQWVTEYERSQAMIVRLDVTLHMNDGERKTIEMSNRGIFLEADAHPPKVERQIADVVNKDFAALARELSRRGHQIDDHELCEMYVHVVLADDLLEALAGAEVPDQATGRAGAQADARLSQPLGPE